MENITEDVLLQDPNTPKTADGKVDYIALIMKERTVREETEKNLKTTEYQKEHFRTKYEELSKDKEDPNKKKEDTDTPPIDKSLVEKLNNVDRGLMVESFLRKHPDVTEDDIKLMEKIKEENQNLEDVYKSEIIQSVIEKRKKEEEIKKASLNNDYRSPSGKSGSPESEVTKQKFIDSLPPRYRDFYKKQ